MIGDNDPLRGMIHNPGPGGGRAAWIDDEVRRSIVKHDRDYFHLGAPEPYECRGPRVYSRSSARGVLLASFLSGLVIALVVWFVLR